MTEVQLEQFKGYLEWYIECAEEDTEGYVAANTLLDDIKEGLQFAARVRAEGK